MESCYIVKKTAPSEVTYFRERSNFPRTWFRDLGNRFWGIEIKHLKAHNSCDRGVFVFHYYLATSATNWDQIFTGLLFYAYYVEKHQVRRLVFDNLPRLSSIMLYATYPTQWAADITHCGWTRVPPQNWSSPSLLPRIDTWYGRLSNGASTPPTIRLRESIRWLDENPELL